MKLSVEGFIRRSVHLAFAASCVVGVAAPALAQDAAAADTSAAKSDSKAVKLEKVEVTGSRIKRSERETASPVQTLSRQDIERSGKATIAQVLEGVSANGQGSIPTAFSNGFASGSSAISLRGLGVNSTLVLLNGRRMAPYGLADDGSRTFTDLNSIPLDAVERVEILKDGASAIYGSDAVGGVVNIILRQDFQGGKIGGTFGTSEKSDGTTQGLTGTFGIGDLEADRYNAFISVEASSIDAIRQTDRDGYLGTNDLRKYGWYDNRLGANGAGFGIQTLAYDDDDNPSVFGPFFSRNSPYGYLGNILNGANGNVTNCPERSDVTGACVFDPIIYDQIQPKSERLNLFTRGTLAITPATKIYGEVGFFKTETDYTGGPASFNFGNTYNPADPANPLFPAVGVILPASHPDNHTGVSQRIRYLAAETGGRNGHIENEVTRFLAGVTGDFSTWSYDFGALYTESKLDYIRTGFPQFDALQAALNDGSYRINNQFDTPQSVYDSVFPDLRTKSTASVTLIDAHVSGPVVDLAGGPLSVSIGTEYRKEEADSPPVPGTDTGQVGGLGYSAYNSDRNIYAIYTEVEAPVLPMVDLTAAVRYDKYSDYGSSTTPKFGIKVTPTDWLALRGTYSEAFRAPGPTESGNSASLGFTNIAIVSVGDPSVKPEESKSYTLGLVIEPVAGTSLTADYFHIKRENEIIQADQTLVIGDNPVSGGPADGQLPGAQPNSFVYYDGDGNVSAISAPYTNANETITDGFDVDISQRISLGEHGRLRAGLNVTHLFSFKRVAADGSETEYVGTHGPYVLSSAGGTPQDRATLSLSWDYRNFALTANINYVGPMDMIDHQGETLIQSGDFGQVATSTFEAAGFGYQVAPGQPVCGVYAPNGTAPNNCELQSFTTLDLFARWTNKSKDWEISGSVQNALNKMAPFDPYTYGGTNYNPAFHQSGAVGRFYTLGAKYSFGGKKK